MAETEDEIHDRWCAHLGKVKSEVMHMYTRRYVWRTVRDIALANPQSAEPAFFHAMFTELYATAAAVAVRRLADTDSRTLSLERLLAEIEERPEVLSRERYVSLYKAKGYASAVEMGNSGFDDLTGIGNLHIQPSDVSSDRQRLQEAAEKIKPYVDKHIAHSDATPAESVPTYAEIDEAIDLVGELLKLYSLRLQGISLGSLCPVFQYDWMSVFERPWLPDRSSFVERREDQE